MNWPKLFGLKRKLALLCLAKGFFELPSKAREGKKDKVQAQKCNYCVSAKQVLAN